MSGPDGVADERGAGLRGGWLGFVGMRVRGFCSGGVAFRWCVSFVSSGVVSCVPGCEKRGKRPGRDD